MPFAGGSGGRSPSRGTGASLLETIARNVPIVLFTLDGDGMFTRSEGKALDALGLEPNEVVGDSVFEIYDEYPTIVDSVERALEGESVNEVVELEGATFEVWYRPVGDDGVEQVMGVAIDVTDRARHERLLEQLNEASRGLMVAGSEESVANRIVDISREVLDEPASVVWYYDPDDGVLEPVAGTNPTRSTESPASAFRDLDPIRPGTAEMAAYRQRETVFFDEYSAVEDRAHPDTSLGAILAVPIGEFGLLTVGAKTAADIGSSTPDLAEILARDAAVALERVRRETAVERLHAATRALIEAETTDEIARRTVEACEEILDHPQSVLRLLSEDQTHLEPVAVTEWVERTIPDRPTFLVGEWPIGVAFEQQEPMHFDRSELEGAMSHESTRSLLCLPIGAHGVLSIGEPDPTAFDEPAVQLARILAANVETALDRLDRERELERQNERLEAFAGIVSHDLRNPLNVVSGHLELARHGEADFDAMTDSIKRMETIIDDVLDLAREGRAVTDPETLQLERAARLAWGTVDTATATLIVEDDRELIADADRVRRLLENLFRNAIEHGGEDVTVRIGAIDGGFYVEDDGPGLDPDEHDEIFEMGYSTGEGGTGLGLAIVQEIAEAHGWSLWVSDGRDGGARFDVVGVEQEPS